MAATHGDPGKPAAQRPNVVAIDDDPKLLELLREGLTDDYEVHCATNAQDGLRLIEDKVPSVVLLDIEMPGMDGYAICETIRETAWVRHIPVIFLTGHSGDAFASNASKAGGDAFMTKPFTFPDLIATIEKLRNANTRPK